MEVGNLVINDQGHIGIVTGIGYSGEFKTYLESCSLNPDIHIMTPEGYRLWSYKSLRVIT